MRQGCSGVSDGMAFLVSLSLSQIVFSFSKVAQHLEPHVHSWAQQRTFGSTEVLQVQTASRDEAE